MKEKINQALEDMGKKVVMNSKHVYVNNETGLYLQGVSTVSSIIPKDWLAAWGAKEAVKFLGYSDYKGDTTKAEEILQQIKNFTSPEELITLLKEAKGASTRKSTQALVDGKAGHLFLEKWIQARIIHTKDL